MMADETNDEENCDRMIVYQVGVPNDFGNADDSVLSRHFPAEVRLRCSSELAALFGAMLYQKKTVRDVVGELHTFALLHERAQPNRHAPERPEAPCATSGGREGDEWGVNCWPGRVRYALYVAEFVGGGSEVLNNDEMKGAKITGGEPPNWWRRLPPNWTRLPTSVHEPIETA